MIETEGEAKAFVQERCTVEACEALETFCTLLLAEAQQQNLIARSTIDHLWQRHIADSAQLLDHVSRETSEPWLDLGTGAGFPGIVTAVMRPDVRHVLVESRKRRVEWLERVVVALNMTNVTIAGCRLENVDSFQAGTISARAFAPLPSLINLSSRFSTARTCWVLPKGRSAEQERDELDSPQREMFHVKQSVTSRDAAILVGKGRPKGGSHR